MIASSITISVVSSAISTSIPSASAASPGQGANFTCTSPGNDVMYNISTTAADGGTTQQINSVNPSTGAETTVVAVAAGVGEPNGLGITRNGTAAYYIDEAHAGTVYDYNAITQTTTPFADGNGSIGAVVAGAVDPANGIYYYATYAGGTATLYGFNTTTNTAISGIVATAPLAEAGGNNGDIAFDLLGNLYLVNSAAPGPGGVAVVRGPLPTTAAGTVLTSTVLTTSLPGATAAGGFNGIGFLNPGQLVVERINGTNQSVLYVLNPNTAAIISGPTTETGIDVDLGACSYNPSLIVQTNIVGRYGVGDQFGSSVTGGGITQGNTATTSGSSTGVQAAQVGPVIGVSGDTYTIAQTAASGSLSNYSTTYSCVDTVNSQTVASGSGASFSLPFPSPGSGETGPNVTCVFTETPVAQITLNTAMGSNRQSNTDQFTVAIHTGSASGPVVSDATNSTTTGSGSTVTSGTGTTGTFTATPGTTYYLTQAGSGTTNLSNYGVTITCSDANGVQTGLPTGAPFSGSFALTPVQGANISCTLTNTVTPNASLSIVKSATQSSFSAVGNTITYSFVVTNTGNVTLSAVGVTDTQSAPAGALTTGPTCQALT
ncbi:MAG TPA: hypothetical protein VNG12_00625, partial [Acidimicrobiales bacterium]|nr:hypothetical protein [Acidimicrobiales bacterium]